MKSKELLSDAEIIGMYFARNEDAILYTDLSYGHGLSLFAERILENREDAEECKNDTYLSAWTHIPPVRPRSFAAWLTKVCRNLAFDCLNRKKRLKRSMRVVELTAEMEECLPSGNVEDEVLARELGALINTFLKKLSREERFILMSRCFSMDSTEFIASVLECSEERVRVILHRTRKKLKDYLRENAWMG